MDRGTRDIYLKSTVHGIAIFSFTLSNGCQDPCTFVICSLFLGFPILYQLIYQLQIKSEVLIKCLHFV